MPLDAPSTLDTAGSLASEPRAPAPGAAAISANGLKPEAPTSLLSGGPASSSAAPASPATQHLHELIAHYLQTHYPGALSAFLYASGARAPDPANPPSPDLQTLVEDARAAAAAAEVQRRLATLALEQDGKESLEAMVKRLSPLPADEKLHAVVRSEQVAATNLLSVAVGDVPTRRFDTATAAYVAERRRSVLVASADKVVRVVDYETGEVTAHVEPHKAPALTLALHPTNPRYLASGSMDGTTVLTDLITGTTLQTLPATKFVVRVAFSSDGRWLAAASYDHSISLYEASGLATAAPADEDADDYIPLDDSDDADLAMDPELRYTLRHRVATDANPEAMLFHPASSWLIYTVRGSCEMHYLGLPAREDGDGDDWGWPTRSKSFNPNPLDAHVSFAVLDMSLHPSGRMIACITGDHASSGERVLLYGVEPDETERLGCLWTHTESDDFVLPRVRWLPDGKAVVIGSPTGVVSLIALNGEVRSKLRVHAAQPGVAGTSDVVRDLQVVRLGDGGDEGDEWEVVSVGYDRYVRFSR